MTNILQRKKILKGVALVVLAALFFFLSHALLTPYVGGDQKAYRGFYEQLAHSQFSEIALLQFINTGSAEPFYGLLMWAGSTNGIDKDLYISFFNTLLCCLILILLYKNRSSIIFNVLMFSNYYLIVMLTSAERLKFSYIALVAAAIAHSSLKKRVWAMVSVLFHFQSLILLLSKISENVSKFQVRRRISQKKFLLILITAPISAATLLVFLRLFSDILFRKIESYLGNGDLKDTANILVLITASYFVFKKKPSVVIMPLSLCAIFSIVLGPERVNMIAVSLFVYLVVTQRKTSRPIVLALMLYFSIKSIGFIYNIFEFGNGFHEVGLKES